MWPLDEQMQTFRALPVSLKLRVCWQLARGKAPGDSRMAAAAIELAESYKRQGRTYVALARWLPLFMVVGFGYVTLSQFADGDPSLLFPYSLILVLSAFNTAFNPLAWPKNLSRSLESSRKMVSSAVPS